MTPPTIFDDPERDGSESGAWVRALDRGCLTGRVFDHSHPGYLRTADNDSGCEGPAAEVASGAGDWLVHMPPRMPVNAVCAVSPTYAEWRAEKLAALHGYGSFHGGNNG